MNAGGTLRIAIPPRLVGDRSTMYAAFLECAEASGHSRAYATELVRLLPQTLKEAPVWFEKINKLWRYEYGEPYDGLPGGVLLGGTNVHHPVVELYSAMVVAERWLTSEQLLRFLDRLADAAKHEDVVFEMRPPATLRRGSRARYEVPASTVSDTDCDWLVKWGPFRIFVEVKNRIRSLIAHMEQFIPQVQAGARSIPVTAPDPADLFKSVELKFPERSPLRQLQGVWIQSGIKEDETALRHHFRQRLNPQKVHFVVLSDWKGDAFILARWRPAVLLLRKAFGLTESTRFVTSDYPHQPGFTSL